LVGPIVVPVNAYPCFGPMQRKRIFANAVDGQGPLAVQPTARPIAEVMGRDSWILLATSWDAT